VTRIGFEPMTPSLEGWCSIQLSYRAGCSDKTKKCAKVKKISQYPACTEPCLIGIF
jgi:hypothetical protein